MRCNPRLLLRDITVAVAATLVLILGVSAHAQQDDIAVARNDLVVHIQQITRVIASQTGVASIDAKVLDAFARVPRHRFVPGAFAPYAYQDVPLPLGYEQNLTQPSLLALMTQVLEIKPGQRVFETGTDTGYQAAILAELKAEAK